MNIGENLARKRRRAGLTQEGLAERSGVSISVIRKLERGDRDSASLPTLRSLATALGVTTVELFRPTPTQLQPPIDDRSDLYLIRRALQPARTADGDLITLADDVQPGADDVADSVREISGLFRDSDYAGAVAALPTAISHARAAVAEADEPSRPGVWGQLAQVYQTAALVLIQLRKDDLAYHALGLAMDAGRRAGDDVLTASVVCSEGWLLTRQARFDEAERAALVTAEAIEPRMSRSPASQVAVWGWLNLGAAAAATRNNRMDVAADSLRRAHASAHVAAGHVPPRVAHWTTFAPAVVAMREVELAMVVGDAGRAAEVARTVPPGARPAVTYQRFRLDVAAAALDRRRRDEALAVLLRLRESAPEWLRYQRYAQRLVERLLHARSRAVQPELRALADFLNIA
ncbi:helix-turn-helix transcriptional regulator [Solwaraspora sp. WMMD791]|uniref:helix-turn-helix domain-containing protein n=1 Tax=Solwaraspora sp. WMMD791 TaxID=3016086 RepID=UPI00249CA248|nr:helix-turn-helix transcriptional regulator [Solwaraspora sp. WMMD791]WFE26735.1 helix-turn-helix transcriptional regulator [Solwaraspora sp. WMMD791]